MDCHDLIRNPLSKIGFITIIVLIVYAVSCKKEVDLPTVVTKKAQIIDAWTATTGGFITSDGGSSILDKGVVWNDVAKPTLEYNMSHTSEGNGSGSFSSTIGVLTKNTKYYVRAYATNKAGTAYGNEDSFVFEYTQPASEYILPKIRTKDATEIRSNAAICGGVVTMEGYPRYTSCGICWSTHTDPTINDSTATCSLNSLDFNISIKNLESTTLYYVRAYAVNLAGTSYGNQVSFTTLRPGFPVVKLTNITGVDLTSATCYGDVVTDEGLPISDRGFCWGINPDPIISGDTTINGYGIGKYSGSLKGLSFGTKYYVRAFAKNSAGIAYSDVYRFNTIDTGLIVKDAEGNLYNTVAIGEQTWLSSNLRSAKFSNGDTITEQCAYEKNEAYVAAFGRLYKWSVAISAAGACPVGWHVPTSDEWRAMATYLVNNGFTYDGSVPSFNEYVTVGKGENRLAKSLVADSDWGYSDVQGSPGNPDYPEKRNVTKFNAVPAGWKWPDGTFMYLGSYCSWWNSDLGGDYYIQPGGYGYYKILSKWQITYDSPNLGERAGTDFSVSIRCIKNK